MALRKGKTKATLESSREAALLAVEIYNKPRIGFRSEGYIALMIIAWTRLFHAHFNNTIGDKYYYKLAVSTIVDSKLFERDDEKIADILDLKTDFEKRWNEQGLNVNHCAWVKK